MHRGKLKQLITLSRRAYGGYVRQMALLTILGFGGGFFEGVGVNALIPLLSFFTEGGAREEMDFISRLIKDFFAFIGVPFELSYLLVFISLLFLAKALLLLVSNYVASYIRADYEKQTRDRLLRKTLAASWPLLVSQKVGHLQTYLTANVQLTSKLLGVFTSMIVILTGLVMYLTVAVNISPPVTLATLGLGLAVFALFKPVIRITRALARSTAGTNLDVGHAINETILGLKTVKALNAEEEVSARNSVYFEILKRLKIKTLFTRNLISVFVQPISVIFIALIFAFSYYVLGGIDFAVLAALIYLIQRIFSYVQQFQIKIHSINNLFPYLKDMFAYESSLTEYHEEGGGDKAFSFNSEVCFRGVSFSYPGTDLVLKNVSFSVKKGEMAGLIGLSGSGKTTLFDILLRILRPTSGVLTIDGEDINGIRLTEWRRRVGYVSQDIFLINGSIAENIRFYDDELSDADIEEAARKANVFEFADALPDGLAAPVGERGLGLSAGQRQRIAIARVLARKPEILLLDEATSALDNESELRIQESIERLKGEMTVLVIAHRLSTVMNADNLIVLDKGRIVEEGAPRLLLDDKRSYFYKVYNIRNK